MSSGVNGAGGAVDQSQLNWIANFIWGIAGFLASVLPYTQLEWVKLATFLNLLPPKLPAPREEDLSKGMLDGIDMDSYRVEVRAALQLALPDADAELRPLPLGQPWSSRRWSWTG